MMRYSRWLVALTILALLTAASAQPAPPISQPDNCTRADIVAAVTDNPNWTSTVSLVTLLNATYLLPDGTGPGTVLLPTNNAFQNLDVTPQRLVEVHGTRMVSVLVYHSLLNTNAALSVAQLLAASPIQSDLGVLVSAGANRSVQLPVFVNNTDSVVVAQGLATPDVGRFGREIRVCGLALHEIDVLLRPFPFEDTPNAATYFNGTIPRNIANLTSPFGFAPSITNGTLPVSSVPFNGTEFNGTTSFNGTAGGGTRQFNGTDGNALTAAAAGAFGSALAANPDGEDPTDDVSEKAKAGVDSVVGGIKDAAKKVTGGDN